MNYYVTDSVGENGYSKSSSNLSLAVSTLNMIIDIFNTMLMSYVVVLVKHITEQDKTVRLSKFAVTFHIAMFCSQAIVSVLYTAILLVRHDAILQNQLQYIYVLVCNTIDYVICI